MGSDAALGRGLGRVGVWIGGYGPPAKVDLDIVGEIEALGFGAFWFGEAPGGREPFVRATMLLAGTERIVVATGIAIGGPRPSRGREPSETQSSAR